LRLHIIFIINSFLKSFFTVTKKVFVTFIVRFIYLPSIAVVFIVLFLSIFFHW